ncbi:hypothetical protein [Saccharothrix longispora]|uniref:hypothetical protein n=1 Tax=Saccharothrix longispora TaxID=33920 RepID=UPI00286B14C5|nr:hypothetical protein [Saccharothrix longispora]
MNNVVYGTSVVSLDELRLRLEDVLEIPFHLHCSSYSGGDYYRAEGDGDENLIIVRNDIPEDDGEVLYPELERYTLIFGVYSTPRGDHWREALGTVAELEFIEQRFFD